MTANRSISCAAPAALLTLAMALAGCGGEEAKMGVALYAGAGLRPAVEDLVRAFRTETGIEVVADYAGSGVLISRAREDDDADLFMPGDVWYVDRLQELTGKVVSKTQVSWFVPVIIVRKGNPKKIAALDDFFRDDVKVALGNPKACQVGRISGEILRKNGLDRSRLPNVKESLTVNELGVWVKMGDVDASIVWDAIAANVADAVDVIPIPKDRNVISNVVVGLLSTSRNRDAAKRFIDFMTSEAGRAILKRRGYRTEAP